MNGSKESAVNSADCVGTEKQMVMNKIIITHSVVAGMMTTLLAVPTYFTVLNFI